MTPIVTRLALLAVIGAGTAFGALALPAFAAPAPTLNCALPANANAPDCKNVRRPGKTPAHRMTAPRNSTMGTPPGNAGMDKSPGNTAPPAVRNGPQRGPGARNAPPRSGPMNFSAPDRARFRQHFRNYRFPTFEVPTFGINIGVSVPRSYRLRPVPYDIYRYYPGFRGYLYFVLRSGDVVIVDQRNLRIVAII